MAVCAGVESKLRTGLTTGTCATAASKAALISIIEQKAVESVSVTLPKGKVIEMKIHRCEFTGESASCSVIKDGGDDPDVTHGAEICADVTLAGPANQIKIEGGEGVGKVTKPGLGLEIGGPAINPTPKKMIIENVTDAGKAVLKKSGVKIVISVPRGRQLAPKTDNPRLGIAGGISILGTSGIVIPFSTASFAASIRQNLDVAVAMGDRIVVLTTGGRSEDFARGILKLPDHCFVKMGDFAGYAIRQCAKKEMKKTYVAGFVGKLAKMAAGAKQTHVKGSKVDTGFLAGLARQCNVPPGVVERIAAANTARHVLEIVGAGEEWGFFRRICAEVHARMQEHSGGGIPIEVVMFDFDGGVLARHPNG